MELSSDLLPAIQLLQLLEIATELRETDTGRAHGGSYGGVADDYVLRMVTFRSHEEAARRAVLLLALSWDPLLGVDQSTGQKQLRYPVITR